MQAMQQIPYGQDSIAIWATFTQFAEKVVFLCGQKHVQLYIGILGTAMIQQKTTFYHLQ